MSKVIEVFGEKVRVRKNDLIRILMGRIYELEATRDRS